MHAPVKRMFLYHLCNESRLRLHFYTNLGLLHANHEGLMCGLCNDRNEKRKT